MFLYPMFGGSGVGLEQKDHYFIPETQLCIWDRAFPKQEDHEFIKLSTKARPLTIGHLIPNVFEGKVYNRKIAENGWHYHEYEVTHDGFGNKPVWLYVKDLLTIKFNDYSKNAGAGVFEEHYAIEYLKTLPPDMRVLILIFM